MDCSTIEHSDSDSGDSWTLIENSSAYADDAPDVPDHPTESNTAENLEKDEDTDGISIITDSEPESSSPCQLSYEHYLTEENSTSVHHLPQFITVNSDLHDDKSPNESKEDDDLLGESGGKHKTYVHRRNKRLSTVLNIVMLGSVITAAGVAIGHMWGAKTDCSMHTPTNVNKILSNLYKLQEENAYLWSKLKELTALNNYQNNQQKTNLKQNKCKKMFEEPLINNESKKATKCVDDINYDKLINSHMAEAAKKEKPDEFLNETKDLTNERKSYADSLKYFENVHIKENQAFKLEKTHSNKNHKLLKRSYDSEVGSSYNDVNKQVNVNKKEYFFRNNNKLRGEPGYEANLSHKNTNEDLMQSRGESHLYDEFIDQEVLQNIKKRKNKKTIREESKDSDRNKTPNEAFGTEAELLSSIKDKNKKTNKKSENNVSFQKKYKDNNETPNGDYGTEEDIFKSMEHRNRKEDKIESDKMLQMEYKDPNRNKTPMDFGRDKKSSKSLKDKNPNKKYRKEKTKVIKTKDYNINQTNQEEFGNKKESRKSVKDKILKKEMKNESNAVKTDRTDFENNKTSKDDNIAEKIVVKFENNDFNTNKNINAKYDYHFDSSEDEIKKDNRYVTQKQKPERKKYDRQQLHKKNKKKNKYEQWEMKGGLFKDFDDISTISSQDKEYLFEPNLTDDKVFTHQLDNNIDINMDTSDNLRHNAKNTKMNADNEDEINWLDKRAKFRKEARQQFEEEGFNKNGVNAAGWYFRRMRKREQSRGKGDNGTYRKFLKHNFKLKH